MISRFRQNVAGLFRPATTTLAMAATCLLVIGCVEQSTVVKIKTDGSGLVHIRVHKQDAPLISFSSEPEQKSDVSLPSKEELAELAKKMGKGVEVVSSLAKANRHGWPGYELILQFKDVNQLTIPGDLLAGLEPETSEADSAAADPKKQNPNKQAKKKSKGMGALQGNTKFALHDGVLKIHTSGIAGHTDGAQQDAAIVEGAVDPFATEPASPLAKMSLSDRAFQEIAAQLMADARVGFFVQIDGKVVESNAKFRKDNLVTIAQANFGEILKDAKGMADLKSLEANASRVSRKMLSTISEKIPGLDIDLQNPIEVRFK